MFVENGAGQLRGRRSSLMGKVEINFQ